MSPEKKRDFEAEWPLLARRLRLFLGRKHVPHAQQDDLIQETALRLYKMWDSVDRARPAWALTVTIALNLLRDEYRRSGHADIVAELPDVAQAYDLERAGLARIELKRVRDALTEMSPEHRSVLLAEIGQHRGQESLSGEKMRRLRARRKLTQLMERVSAVVLLPVRRLTEAAHGLLGIREALAQSASCVLCGVLGVAGVLAIPAPPARSATPSVDGVRVATSSPSSNVRPSVTNEVELVSRATAARARALEAASKGPRTKQGQRFTRPAVEHQPEPLGVDPDDVTNRLPKATTPPPPPVPVPEPPPAPKVPIAPGEDSFDPARMVREVTTQASKLLP